MHEAPLSTSCWVGSRALTCRSAWAETTPGGRKGSPAPTALNILCDTVLLNLGASCGERPMRTNVEPQPWSLCRTIFVSKLGSQPGVPLPLETLGTCTMFPQSLGTHRAAQAFSIVSEMQPGLCPDAQQAGGNQRADVLVFSYPPSKTPAGRTIGILPIQWGSRKETFWRL